MTVGSKFKLEVSFHIGLYSSESLSCRDSVVCVSTNVVVDALDIEIHAICLDLDAHYIG